MDCGQDIFRLAQALRYPAHRSSQRIAAWSSADMSRMGLPSFDVPPPFQPVSGWFAISRRAQRSSAMFFTRRILLAHLRGWILLSAGYENRKNHTALLHSAGHDRQANDQPPVGGLAMRA